MIIYGKEKEILKAQKRSLAAWINNTLGATLVDADNLISKLSTGVILCMLAKCIQKRVDETHYPYRKNEADERQFHLKYWERAKRETFFARDNAEMFIRWCKSFGVREAVLFESDGLVMQTQPRTVILCLLELARLASKYGVLLPPPIQLPPTTISIDDISDCSEDEFLYATTLPSPTLISASKTSPSNRCWDSGCSSGQRSPSASSVFSKTPSPSSSLKKKKDKSVVVVLRSSKSDDFLLGSDVKRSTPRVSPKRSSSMVRTDTISSRLKRSNTNLTRSNSSIMSSKSSISRTCKGSNNSLISLSQHRRSALDKRVSEVARQYLKEEDKIQRLSEGHYVLGDKNVYLRIVRGNNVVVRIGGGWDTLEHFLSVLEANKRHGPRSGNLKRRPARSTSCRT